jgi:hypothetical protein
MSMFVLAACSSDPAPTLTIESATPDTLAMSNDAANDLAITVRYTEPDGDLGGGTAEVNDCRADGLVTQLAIPPIAAPGVVAAKSPISGTLAIYVDNVGPVTVGAPPAACASLGVAAQPDGQTIFCVYLVDAAGHRSAGTCTKAIALLP